MHETAAVQFTAPSYSATIVAPASDSGQPLCELAAQLGALGKDASVDQVVEVGRRVIEHLYDGELSAWRSRGPKAHSLRALARRSDLPVSSSALYRAVALYELSERLGGLGTWARAGLGISHLRLVLGLPADDQRRLLDRAAAESWTVAEFERATAEVRRSQPDVGKRGGRPRLPRFVKVINRLRRCVDNREELFGDLAAAARLDAAKRSELREALRSVREACEQLERSLDEPAERAD